MALACRGDISYLFKIKYSNALIQVKGILNGFLPLISKFYYEFLLVFIDFFFF